MPNHLSLADSPYLAQHAENPVDWFQWGEEALEKAHREDKPIFLSIGYAACHWCHVMAHESFEDEETAAIMNHYFVNIKVDREERPDLDSIYMNAVVSITGQGGWPLSVFLTPEGRPFYGGTYFPPVRRYNMPAFREVLLSVASSWKENRQQLLQTGDQLTQHLLSLTNFDNPDNTLKLDTLDQATLTLAQSYDWKFGGWGKAPKFPQALAIEFLLRRAVHGDNLALEIATHALRSMAKGGMYDVIGGGFARYSTDDEWLVPHFEKMLYDNALLASAYLHAFLLTGDTTFRRVCDATLNFIIREMTDSQGGFFSSLDADSEGQEGKYYLWTFDEICNIIGERSDIEFFTTAYNIPDNGNFEGKIVLQRALTDSELSEQFQMDNEKVQVRLDQLHTLLLQARGRRVRPSTDDKVLVSWNVLMVLVFSEAVRYLGNLVYLDMAIRNMRFILSDLHPQDRLLRSWRAGKAMHNAYLEDYAALILALLSLYQSDPNPHWFSNANSLAEEMVEHYYDGQVGFFDTRDDHEPLITRPRDLQDNATPSGNALAATALLQIAAFENRADWRKMAEVALIAVNDQVVRYPSVYSQWLCAMDFALHPPFEIAILGNLDDPLTLSLSSALWSSYHPNLVAAISSFPPAPHAPALLSNRPLLNGRPTAYVCRSFICHQPVNTPEELLSQLMG